jgi:hypothetical protein
MKKLAYLGFAICLGTGLSFASPRVPKGKTFVGNISDSMCGAKHMMPGKSDKECTLECIKGGSKFVLVDPSTGKIYQLSDQKKPEQYAGQKVTVSGTLKGETIDVTSIEAAH